jgi:hypothetical protein
MLNIERHYYRNQPINLLKLLCKYRCLLWEPWETPQYNAEKISKTFLFNYYIWYILGFVFLSKD